LRAQYCGGAKVDAPSWAVALRPARIVEHAARKRDRDNVWNWHKCEVAIDTADVRLLG
jgi:hypothetical protein